MTGAVALIGISKVIDLVATLVLAGFEREPLVAEVRGWEEAGWTMQAITDALQAKVMQTEANTQAIIDKAPE